MRGIRDIRSIRDIRKHFSGGAAPFAFGNALRFDGVDDNVTLSEATWGPTSTISFWFRTNNFLSMPMSSGVNNDTWVLFTDSTTINTRSTAADSSAAFTVPVMSTGTWYHCVIVRTSGTTRLYLNGTQSVTGGISQPTSAAIGLIGMRMAGTFHYSGDLDEIGLKNGVAATAQNISDLYNGGNGNSFTAIMGASNPNYHFDETGTATTAIDSGGTSNDGTLVNFPSSGMWNPH